MQGDLQHDLISTYPVPNAQKEIPVRIFLKSVYFGSFAEFCKCVKRLFKAPPFSAKALL